MRLFAYGFLAIVLALYLAQIGLNDQQIGALLSGTLVGDAIISLWLTRVADRLGRRRMLLIGAGLMILAGVVFALTSNILLLAVAAIIGTHQPERERGRAVSVHRASRTATDDTGHAPDASFRVVQPCRLHRDGVWIAVRWRAGGLLQRAGSTPLDSYRVVIIGYALAGRRAGASVHAASRSRLKCSAEAHKM